METVFRGTQLVRFRFDVVQAQEHEIVLLTAACAASQRLAFGMRKELAESFFSKLRQCQAEIGHSELTFHEEVQHYLELPLVQLLEGAFKLPRDRFVKVISFDAYPAFFTFDFTDTSEVTSRFSMHAALAFVFAEQLDACTSVMK